MKKRNETTKMNTKKKAILFTIIGFIIAVEIYSSIKSSIDTYNEEKTNINASPIASSSPSVILIEPTETQAPLPESEIYAELLYENELTPLLLEVQGFNFSDFYAFNPDTVGVLAIPGTNIYFPVCGSDNDDEWLETLYNGRESIYGTIFLDYMANKNIDGKISTLFGHNMSDGRMFAPLNKYFSYNDYYKTHQYASISTKDYIYIYKFACVAKVTLAEGAALRQTNFSSDEEYKKYVEILKNKTKYKDDSVSLETSEKLLQLMTCIGNHNYRTSVIFSYENRIPNILNNNITTEEIQKNINEIASRKSSFFHVAQKIVSYNLPSSSNYVVLQGINDGIYVWTKDALTEKERVAFIEMYNLDLYGSYTFINGHNSFDIDGIRVALEPDNGSTIIYSKENGIKLVKSGEFSIGIKSEREQKRIYKID